MERQTPRPLPLGVIVSRRATPTPTDLPDQDEELGYEELEARLAPGTTVPPPKKTAGWGC